MRVLLADDVSAAATAVAARLVAVVRRNPSCVLGLAAGRTMVPVYEEVLRRLASEGLTLRHARAFAVDEYVSVAPAEAVSMVGFIERHFIRHTDLPESAWETPDARSARLLSECLRYEDRIRRAGGIDLILLGLGRNGHIAFNEPGSSLAGQTTVEALTRATRDDNRGPELALTMGVGTILDAGECLLAALGEAKARAVADAVEGPLSAWCPASALQLHPAATLVLDPAAARELRHRERYRRREKALREILGG